MLSVDSLLMQMQIYLPVFNFMVTKFFVLNRKQ